VINVRVPFRFQHLQPNRSSVRRARPVKADPSGGAKTRQPDSPCAAAAGFDGRMENARGAGQPKNDLRSEGLISRTCRAAKGRVSSDVMIGSDGVFRRSVSPRIARRAPSGRPQCKRRFIGDGVFGRFGFSPALIVPSGLTRRSRPSCGSSCFDDDGVAWCSTHRGCGGQVLSLLKSRQCCSRLVVITIGRARSAG